MQNPSEDDTIILQFVNVMKQPLNKFRVDESSKVHTTSSEEIAFKIGSDPIFLQTWEYEEERMHDSKSGFYALIDIASSALIESFENICLLTFFFL